jgi:hypothetical protein
MPTQFGGQVGHPLLERLAVVIGRLPLFPFKTEVGTIIIPPGQIRFPPYDIFLKQFAAPSFDRAVVNGSRRFLFSTLLMIDGWKYEIKLFKRISFYLGSIDTGHRGVKEKVNLCLWGPRVLPGCAIESATIINNVRDCEQEPTTEWQVRPLSKIKDLGQRIVAWKKVVETAPDGEVTGGRN